MGDLVAPVEPLPKPSRFQFVPVPGEFTRGRWKCRDSYHPYAETLEFEKKTSKEEANPDKISVSFKLRQSKEEEEAASGDALPPSSSTIQVTSVKSTNGEMAEEANSSLDNIVITRKNGVTIVRKTSTAAPPDHCDKIRELSIDDFETKQEKVQQVPPTPMNTPPATLQEPIGDSLHAPALAGKPKIFQVQSVIDSTPTRKFSDTTVIQQHAPEGLDDSAYSATVPAQKARLFQVEPVVDPQFSQPSPVAAQEIRLKDEPTFQVIQTEESKNMSLDSVKNVIDMSSTDASRQDLDTPTKSVQITVSAAAADKKDTTAGSLEGCGIPIPPTAPHSTPYGTPKDTQKFPTFDEALKNHEKSENAGQQPAENPPESSTISVLSQEKPVTTPEKTAEKTTSASAPLIAGSLLPPVSVNVEPSLPIDNKIEQAMELVKTHLTYAVREEVDTLRNTIADLEYQMREFQFECSYFRQNCPPETVEAAGAYVRQQMQKLQPPTRRAVSTTCAPSMEGIQQATNVNSSHMRNLQTQIQQIKQIIPVAIVPKPSPTNSSTPSTTSGNPNEIDASLQNIHVNNMTLN